MSHRLGFSSLCLAVLALGCGTSSPSPVGPVRAPSSATAREAAPAPVRAAALPAYCPAPLATALASGSECRADEGASCADAPAVFPALGPLK